MVSFETPIELQAAVAKKAKERRKWLRLSREEAAEKSGVPESTLRKFEQTGEISLRQFLMLLHAYGNISGLDQAFVNPPAKTMDELIKLAGREKR